jgi:hypothetical protein
MPDEPPVNRIRLPRRSNGVRAGNRGMGRIPASRNALLTFQIT